MSEKGGNCIGTRDSEVGQSIFEACGIRESSFNMTRGGDEDIERGLRKFLDTQRGGL